MTDFPRSLPEFQRRFGDEAACAEYLAAVRWADGFRCPACGGGKGWRLSTKPFTWECADCSKQTSITAGTVMHGSKLELTMWFWAAYLMATHSNGISATQLQLQLGIGSYKTAWLLCAKLRRAMVDPDRNPLTGLVEVDETTIPFRTKDDPVAGGGGRSQAGKMPVIAAVEIAGDGPGRVRLAPIADYSGESIGAFVATTVACGATLKADGMGRLSRYRRGRPRTPCRRHHGRPPRPSVDPSRVREPQTLGARRLPRPAPKPSAILPRRVRLPLQPPPHPPRRLPLAARDRRPNDARHLQDVDLPGSKGISLSDVILGTEPASFAQAERLIQRVDGLRGDVKLLVWAVIVAGISIAVASAWK